MPNDMAVGIAAHKESDERQLKLLEEVVRQAEVRLAALAQTRQMMAAKATSVMTWALTVFIALTAALAASSGTERFVSLRPALSVLWIGGFIAVMCSPIAVLNSLLTERLRDGWKQAGSNPRLFINEMPPKKEKRSLVKFAMKRWLKRSKNGETIAILQATDLFETKAEVLRHTAMRYTQAIDENEQILISTTANTAFSLAVMGATVSVIAIGLIVSSLFIGQQHSSDAQTSRAPSLGSSATPDPTVSNAPGTRKQ